MRRLEEATGLSRGAIFHHFRDKESLFLALAEDDALRMADVVSARTSTSPSACSSRPPLDQVVVVEGQVHWRHLWPITDSAAAAADQAVCEAVLAQLT